MTSQYELTSTVLPDCNFFHQDDDLSQLKSFENKFVMMSLYKVVQCCQIMNFFRVFQENLNVR